MSNTIKTFWLGVFIVAATAIIAWLLLFLKPTVGDGEVKLHVRFTNVDKVEKGTRVLFGGKAVGEVEKVTLIDNPRSAPADQEGNLYIYDVELKVDSSVSVYTYDEIAFSSSGLLGEKSIAIDPRLPPAGAPPAQNITNELLYANSYDQLEQALNQVVTVASSINDSFDEITTSFTDMTNHILYGEGTVGRLVQSDSFYCQLQGVMYELKTVLSDIANYGIFFQFSGSWKKERDMRRRCEQLWYEQNCCEE